MDDCHARAQPRVDQEAVISALALICGDTSWPGSTAGVSTHTVSTRPGREELIEVLDGLDGGRLVVCGTDADLAAVVLRLLRDELLASVTVGYVPALPGSAVARLWGLPVLPSTAARLALSGVPDSVPLLRDDFGGVLVGRGVVRHVDGVAYCDDQVVLRGRASRLEVVPEPAHGLVVRVTRGGLLGRRVRMAAGRAVQLGCKPTEIQRDGVSTRMAANRWTWYRHTSDLQLAR